MVVFLPDDPQTFQLLINEIRAWLYVFAIEVILHDVVNNLLSLLHFQSVKIQQKARKSSCGQFVELQIVLATFQYFKLCVQVEILQLLGQNIIFDAELQHFDGV